MILDASNAFNREREIQKKENSSINWEEDKNIIKQYLRQEYPLTNSKIDKTIQTRKLKYIDVDKYQSFSLKYQAEKLMANMKNSKKI